MQVVSGWWYDWWNTGNAIHASQRSHQDPDQQRIFGQNKLLSKPFSGLTLECLLDPIQDGWLVLEGLAVLACLQTPAGGILVGGDPRQEVSPGGQDATAWESLSTQAQLAGGDPQARMLRPGNHFLNRHSKQEKTISLGCYGLDIIL